MQRENEGVNECWSSFVAFFLSFAFDNFVMHTQCRIGHTRCVYVPSRQCRQTERTTERNEENENMLNSYVYTPSERVKWVRGKSLGCSLCVVRAHFNLIKFILSPFSENDWWKSFWGLLLSYQYNNKAMRVRERYSILREFIILSVCVYL